MDLGVSSLSPRPFVFLALVLTGSTVLASEKPRAFDARVELTHSLIANPSLAQRAAQERLAGKVRGLAVSFDSTTGAARTVSSHTGYLTPAAPSEQTPLSVGLAFVRQNRDLLGLTEADLASYEVTDEVYSQATGATHLYLRQTYAGLPLYNGQLQFNVNRDGKLISVNNAFLPDLAHAVNTITPAVDAATAVALADPTGRSLQTSEARLMWLPLRAGQARLVWNFQIETRGDENWYDVTVDAVTGKVWTRFDWVADASYRVYPQPIESPNHTTPLPPSDARLLLVNPQDTFASPFGWHDTNGATGAEFTIHRGNNTHTWEDSDGDDAPPPAGTEPDCGAGLLCDFPINLSGQPSTYRPASVANLFYWTNTFHDILWQYGFDEPGGNFQVNNYGRGGLGNDDVMGLAQSPGNCNAFFSTPPDGQRPLLRVLTCNAATPARDGALDNGLVAHELGHGVSNRIVGGPSNVSCLQNAQQPGEGWSDWYALVLTALPTDTGPMPRGFGTYFLGQRTTDPGGRSQRYSTDPSVNTWTFASITGMVGSHAIGSVWAQAIWEVYWDLVIEHGFDPDLSNAAGDAGNQRALLYVTEGLKDTACGPSFLDARNGILQAAMDNHNGEDACRIWQAFANFGLGVDATTPGPNSTTGVNGFNIPPSCVDAVPPGTVSPFTTNVCAGQEAHYTVTLGQAFMPPVTLSATGPGTSMVSFTPNPVPTVPNTSAMTVGNTAGVAAGTYVLTVNATDTVQPRLFDAVLNVFSGNPATPALTAPANGSVGAAPRPTLTWTAPTGAASYTVQIATDAAFSNVVYTASNVTVTSHTVGSNLAANTQYFWRVIPANPCGAGMAAAPFTFTTVNQICASPNLAIPDNSPAGVTSDLVVPAGGTLTDLNVILKATHTWVGDLIVKLTNVVTGMTVTFLDRPGVPTSTNGCSGNDIDATLDDEAATPVETQCSASTPTISGSFTPNNPLSAFDGQSLAGTWRLTVSDNVATDIGTLTEWCLAPVATLPIGIFSDGFESGNTSAWSGASLLP